MKLFFIAGERSGDLHSSNLIRSLSEKSSFSFSGFGGDEMKNAGCDIIAHYRDFSVMGFVEVVKQYSKIKKYLQFAKESIIADKPSAVVLVDFGGFNLKIAKFAKKENIPVIFYISPKVWAWNTGRTKKLKKYIDHMMVILPFEKGFFREWDWKVEYVGNPVKDALVHVKSNIQNLPKEVFTFPASYKLEKMVALLPGSRNQEVEGIKPLFLDLIKSNPKNGFLLAAVDNLNKELYKEFDSLPNVKVVYNQTYELLLHSDVAVVTSGTATLETALLNIPQVVVYKTSFLSYHIAKNLIKVPYISLVNLITNKETVKELIQDQASLENLNSELSDLMYNSVRREKVLNEYNEMNQLLGAEKASEMAAQSIVKFLNIKN